MVEPEILLGPPGTGKTTSLLEIVDEELANGVHPSRIAYLSFTRRAAEEAISRACTKFSGCSRSDFPYFRTLHSLCFRLMGLTSSGILEGRRLEEFGKRVGYRITGKFSLEDGTMFGFERGDRLLFMENLARVRGVPLRSVYDEDHDDLSFHEVDRFARTLAEYKAEMGIVDFTDMLSQFVESGTPPEIDVLIVDEAQDLSQMQWRVVRRLADGARRFVIAGDDDQAIYRWAGADVETLITMAGDTRVLSQSYRVPRAVQRLAGSIISRVHHRREKIWRPRDSDGELQHHATDESIDLSGPDILVLGRNRYVLREFENKIRALGYLYEFQGAQSIRPSVLGAVLTWERLRQGRPGISASDCRKMYDLMSSGHGVARGHKTLPRFGEEEEVTIEALHERGGLQVPRDRLWYDALDKLSGTDVSYIRAARRRGETFASSPRIRLSTIHGMKGGEARQVVLLTDMATRTYQESLRSPEDEARVWYVGATRARESLHIVSPQTTRFYKMPGG